ESDRVDLRLDQGAGAPREAGRHAGGYRLRRNARAGLRGDRRERQDDQGPRAAGREGYAVPDDGGVPRRPRREPPRRDGCVLTPRPDANPNAISANSSCTGRTFMARTGKVTVVGAGFYGSTTAQRLAEYDIFDEVVLTDIVEGKPEGLALDMSQSRPIEG